MRIAVSIGGVEYQLDNGAPLQVLNIDNLGPSKAVRITERGPGQDGDTDLTRVLEARVIPITLQARTTAAHSNDTNRDYINNLFRATNVPIVLIIERDDGTIFHIDTHSTGGVTLPINIQSKLLIKAGVTLRAANPTFYDPNTTVLSFGIAGGSTTFTIPMPVPTLFGASTLDQTITHMNTGTYKAFPVITIYGPITNPIIYNNTTDGKLNFTGYTIANGDYYTIDLRYGRKLVYRNGDLTDNRIHELSTDSTIATFAIETSPEVAGGINELRVTGTAINNATQIYIQYNRRFDGI